jgi:hypothetical protein
MSLRLSTFQYQSACWVRALLVTWLGFTVIAGRPFDANLLLAAGQFSPNSPAATPDAAFQSPETPESPATTVAADGAIPHIAAWPFFERWRRPIYDSAPGPVTPHPAVARIIVPEGKATAYGSGTLVDVRDQYGLVVTNWHVVSDSKGVVEVVFPNGFRSQARPLKVDKDWDLAALVIWRPPIEPVKLAEQPPRPGDLLTIHGYGQGDYRIATGRCTSYYAPRIDFPQEMVELDVEARQGDSGGPIFNGQGNLAGVLFGAGEGTTLGSFGPRVNNFLATLAPDIGQARDQAQMAVADRPAPLVHPLNKSEINPRPDNATDSVSGPDASSAGRWTNGNASNASEDGRVVAANFPSSPWSPPGTPKAAGQQSMDSNDTQLGDASTGADGSNQTALSWQDITGANWYEPLKSLLAMIGFAAIALHVVKLVR